MSSLRRAKLSLSNAYLIVHDGKDNVRQTTFDNIATALGQYLQPPSPC